MVRKIFIENSERKIAPNFKESEFYTKDPNFEGPHIFDATLISISQYLRTELASPMRVHSTYRSAEYNATIRGSASKSRHVHGDAIDIGCPAKMPALIQLVTEKGPILDHLVRLGIRGIGLYNTFIHLDTRPATTVIRWDNRSK